MMLSQKIGETTFEIEMKAGEEKAELITRDQDTRKIDLMEDFDHYELDALGDFLKKAAAELRRLNEK